MPEPRRRRGRRLLALIAVTLVGCSPPPERIKERLLVWNTEVSIDVVGLPESQARRAIARAADTLGQLSAEWHAWKPSALTRINAQLAAGEPAQAPPSVLALIRRSQPLVRQSDGLFDPAVGSLIALWGFHTDRYPITEPPPAQAAIDAWLAQRPQLSQLRIEGELLRSDNPRLQLDFGAIGEGAAIELVVKDLRASGVINALIVLGGDMVAMGDAGERPWRVAIEDPIGGGGQPLAQLELGDGEALFVSGNYARFRTAPSGERWPHILDPRSGRPASGVAMTAVVGDDLVRADAASTALLIAGPARFAELVERLEIRCALLLTDQNELMLTEALQRRLQLQRQPVSLGAPIAAGRDCRS